MLDHRIIAADWQLQAAEQSSLGAVIVPFEKYASIGDGKRFDALPGAGDAVQTADGDWVLSFPKMSNIEKLQQFALKEYPKGCGKGIKLPFNVGDRIYLAEQWCIDDNSDMYFVESAAPEAEGIEWEPASTMPEEAAVHWYKVTKLRVCEIQMLSINDLERACWTNDWGKVASWDEIYPNHLWNADLWVVVLEIMEVANA